jgi:hypothetical protein
MSNYPTHPSVPTLIVIAGSLEPWESEKVAARAKDREENNRDRDRHLCACQMDQARRGYIISTLHKTIYGWSVRQGNIQNNAFVTPKGGRCNFAQAAEIGKTWVAVDPNKRVLFASKEDVEREERAELLAEASARG